MAILLRTFQLDKVPPSLFGDEIDVGYQAYSLLKTGKDLSGNSWPTLIQSLAEHRAPLYIYSTIPYVATFGLNEWGARLPAALWGIIGILGLFILTKKLFNEKVALISAFILAISPWHMHYSRASFEVTMLLSFTVFSVYFFIKGVENKYLLILSAILFGLTPYIYSTAVIFTPLLLLFLIFIFKSDIKKVRTNFTIAFFVMVLVFLPYGWQTFSGQAGERFSVISIFSNRDLHDKVILSQKEENYPFNLQRFFHNKPLIWGQNFTLNYLRSFSPEFLFLQGDPNFRHSIHEMGELHFFELILLGLGVWVLIKKPIKWKSLVFAWVLIAPIPAALTYDGGFHATRTFLMLPPLMIMEAFGLSFLIEHVKQKPQKILLSALLVIALFNVIFYLHRYFVHYPKESWGAWHFGFKETFTYVMNNQSNYERILINNTYEPSLVRFLFWTKYDPLRFQQQFKGDKPQKEIISGYEGFSLENKFFFGKVTKPIEQMVDEKTLLVVSFRDELTNPGILSNQNIRLLDTIYSPTGEVIFYIVTGNE